MKGFTFFVPGIPAPGGSKRYVGRSKNTGRAILIDAAGEKNRNWRNLVSYTALIAMDGHPPFDCPISIGLTFFMPRPKSHFNSKGELRKSAPAYPTTKPDVLKLCRSTEDAMTGIVFRDDATTINLAGWKRYADNTAAGCTVSIALLVPDEPEKTDKDVPR